MTDAISINLEELQEIMDKLPEPPPGAEKRKHALTKDDVLIIAQVVQAVSHKSCAMGFTVEEIKTVKGVISTVNKGILVVGYAILTALGAGVVTLIGWAVKHGIMDMAQTAQKGAGK